jgi:two-component system phosphate regulon sensor histidine kinase PhoR
MSFLDTLFAKRNEAKSSRQILPDFFKTLREAVIVIDEDMTIKMSNPAAYEAFARGNGQLEGKRLSGVIRELSVHETFQKVLETRDAAETTFEFLTNEKRVYNARIAFLDLENKKGAVGIFYDLTPIERLEKMRQEFLSNVSHELRTPLTSILAFVETLEDGALEDEENNRRFLSVIRKNAQRMHHLIDDILELSSIEAGKIYLEPKPINLSALVEEVFINVSAKAEARKIKLENRIPKDATVFADIIRAEQILTNLVDNAIKFNREAGVVRLRLESLAGRDLIHVQDSGEGISTEHLQRIFERFYRTDRARSREIGGTGLGLAIAKHLARLHGGEISVESANGKGSTFTVEFPRP